MAKDVQNQQLADWLQLMGCPVDLTPEDLQNLNTASMRSIWRHLQSHVKPISTARIIKKNLLLAKLKTNQSLPGKFGNFKIETVQELVQLQRHSATQEEINFVKGKIRAIDESLLSATSSLITKVIEKERMMYNLEEMRQKETLLSLKLACVQSDVEKLDKELETVRFLNNPTTQMSLLEFKENKLRVAKFVQEFSSVDFTDSYIVEVIVSTSEFPPSIIFDGILSVSNHALKSLNFFKTSDALSNLSNRPNSSSKYLSDLNTSIFTNELDLHNSSRKICEIRAELDKERAVLSKLIEEVRHSKNSQDLVEGELFDKLVENTIIMRREEKLKELLDELQDVCYSDFDHAKWTVSLEQEQEDRFFTEVNAKLSDINKLIKQISNCQVSFLKTGVLERARDLVSKFLTKLKSHKNEENKFQVLVSENLIAKEIEMFQKSPLVAMTRQWDDSFETVPRTVREDILKAAELFSFLCQSESKNLIKSIIEKTFWLHTKHR